MKIKLESGIFLINTDTMEIYKEINQGYTNLLTSKEINDIRNFIKVGEQK